MPKISFLFLGLCLLLFSAGCRDRCEKLDCGPNGSCVEGECVCTSGYDGTLCDEGVADKFTNTYSLTESCRGGDDYYNVKMFTVAGQPSDLYIVGIWEKAQDTVLARVADDGRTIAIDRQRVDNVDIAGTGIGSDNGVAISFDYEVYFPGQTNSFDRCTAELELP